MQWDGVSEPARLEWVAYRHGCLCHFLLLTEEQMRRNVSMVLQRMQNVVPFLILFFLKKLYQHSLGKPVLPTKMNVAASSDPKSDQPCTKSSA